MRVKQVVAAVLLCAGVFVLFRPSPRLGASSLDGSSVDGPSVDASSTRSPKPSPQQRRSSIWVVRESADRRRLEVLVRRGKDRVGASVLRLPSADSKRMEIPRVAAMRALRACCNLEDTQVETFKQVRHGPFAVLDEVEGGGPTVFQDMTTYVAVVSTKKHVQTAASFAEQAFSGQADWISLDLVSAALQKDPKPGAGLNLSAVMRDDFASVRLFLKPFAATMGQNPIQCLGRAPPGWRPPDIINWPTSRDTI